MRRFLNPVLAALAVVSVAAPAYAETVRIDVPVAYGDIDVSRPDHVTVLKARLYRAAVTACSGTSTSALVPLTSVKPCAMDAYHRALAVMAKRVPQQVALRD